MKASEPKEYWINVYLNPLTNAAHCGAKWLNKSQCIQHSKWDDWICLYRIHVKMDGGYNKRKIKLLMKIFGKVPGVHWGDGNGY